MTGIRQTNISLLCLAAMLAGVPATRGAGFHGKGNRTVSFGGSAHHTYYQDRNVFLTRDVVTEYGIYPEVVEEPIDYQDANVSIFVSMGYFFIDHLEIGVSGSTMLTWYTRDAQSDMSIYDADVYTKYFFDNSSSVTPYAGLRGGFSWLDLDTYQEENRTAGFTFGLEFSGFGPFTWFLEYTSRMQWNAGDLTGTEWQNRVYIGISFYFSPVFDSPSVE